MGRLLHHADLGRSRPAVRVVGAGCVLAMAMTAGVAVESVPDNVAPASAAQHLAEAQSAQNAGRWHDAADHYRQAVALDPSSVVAREGLRAADEVLAGQADATHVADGRDDVRRQLAVVEARAAIERADLFARSGRYAEAEAALVRARANLQNGDDKASIAKDLARVETLLREVQAGQDHQQGNTGSAGQAAALVTAENSTAATAVHASNELHERLARIRVLLVRQHNALALEAARRLVTDMPGNFEAEAAFNDALAAAHVQRAADIAERRDELKQEVLARLHDSLIPSGFDGKPIYPPNWTDRHQDRVDVGIQSTTFEPWHEDLLNRLAARVTVDFDNLAVEEALAFLAKVGSFNLVVDPTVFAAGGKVVTLRATDMRIDTVLIWLGRLTGSTWVISKGAVYFGGDQKEDPVLGVYDLAHLVSAPYDQGGWKIAFDSTGGAGGGLNIFEKDKTEVDKVAPEDLVDLVKNAVSPGKWDTPEQTLEIRGNVLYVTASRTTHQLLQEFLRSQAYARSLVVHVTCRWLTINDTYLEQIGVDWGSAQSLLQVNGRVPQGYADNTATSVWGGNVLNVLPATGVNGAANLATAGLNLSVLRIGEPQWSAIIKAVEQKGQGRILASPEVTTLNGVRGNAFFGEQHAYIADYEVVNNNLDPTISVLTVGATLDVKPYISADRKYVTMEFRPGLASVTFFTELLSAPRVIGNGNGGGVVTPPLPYPIELPNVAIDEVSTTIIVPDKGMLMVGGFNRAIDQQTSAKVPFLGHIPYLGRLFGTRGRFSERLRLYLLAAVDIIDYREAEENL